jgi:SpoVK/Ycf46/Vps4 family AAA+-type ATPase
VREDLWPAQVPLGQRIALARSQMGTHRLRTLAQPVERHVEADALVLSPALQRRFDALIQRCIQRERLWNDLGPTLSNARNPGVRALFSGDSGTGKTLAASRLASALHAPLFRLDMASLMNKYVGETEKNLSALLDEAAANDAILLLDEADALFGRRSDGDSGGERFANLLTNFLLTRIETHPGIVVLTSNSQARIDDAFTRRFDAVLEFTPPAFEERRRLWANHLGARSPGEQACQLLASYCDLSGGAIRNAVLNAAALQPLSLGQPLQLAVLVTALHEEYRKLGRALPPALQQLGGETDG